MSEERKTSPELEFSSKYNDDHARHYFHKHQKGWKRRLSNWREQSMARTALKMAGDPLSVLDLPCGTGRFWETLAEHPERKIHASDNSESMLKTGLELRPAEITRRLEGNTFTCSAFDIPKPDNFVECLFCMRLLHHIGDKEDRAKMFREFARVASQTVLISLWVDGNHQARRRRRAEQRREKHKYQNRFLFPREQIEAEFADAGLETIGQVDYLKYYSMWSLYVLRVTGGS